MYLTQKVKDFVISASNGKEAYIKGCRELAKYMASKKYDNLSFKITRDPLAQNTFIFSLFTNVDMKEEQKRFCSICKEYHSTFYINKEYNCRRCELKSFLSRCSTKAKLSKNYMKKELK